MSREQTIILLKEDAGHYYIKASKRIVRWGLSALLAALAGLGANALFI